MSDLKARLRKLVEKTAELPCEGCKDWPVVVVSKVDEHGNPRAGEREWLCQVCGRRPLVVSKTRMPTDKL